MTAIKLQGKSDLRNLRGEGTQVTNLEDTRKDRATLDGWIEDVGIGSAIFDSELLQDLMEDASCQVFQPRPIPQIPQNPPC